MMNMKLGIIFIALLVGVAWGNRLDASCTPPIHITQGRPYTPALMSYAHGSAVIVGEPMEYGLVCQNGQWQYIFPPGK
jgi:hypothetical protein